MQIKILQNISCRTSYNRTYDILLVMVKKRLVPLVNVTFGLTNLFCDVTSNRQNIHDYWLSFLCNQNIQLNVLLRYQQPFVTASLYDEEISMEQCCLYCPSPTLILVYRTIVQQTCHPRSVLR